MLTIESKVILIDYIVKPLKKEENELIYLLINPLSGEVLKVNSIVLGIVERLKNKGKLSDVLMSLRQDGIEVTEEDLFRIVRVLMESGFVKNAELVSRPEKRSPDLLRFDLSADKFRIVIRLIRLLSKVKVHYFLPVLTIPFIYVFIENVTEIASYVYYVFNPDSSILPLILFMVFNFLILLLHELAHAVMYFYYGGERVTMGLMEEHGLIMPFTRLHLIDLLDERAQINVFLAGPLTTLLITSIVGYYFYFARDILSLDIKAFMSALMLFHLSGSLFMLYPGLRNDGYFVLTTLLKFPNLHQKAFLYIKFVLYGIFSKEKLNLIREEISLLTDTERTIAKLYAVFLLFTLPLIYGYIIYMLILVQFPTIVLLIISRLRNPNLKTLLMVSLVFVNIAFVMYGILYGLVRRLKK